MARVTVEDCVLKVSNRFQLVMMAAQRSRVLSVGGELTVERDNDKNPVVALREIAEETIPLEELENDVIEGLQRNIDVDEPIETDDDEILFIVLSIISKTCRTSSHKTVCSLWTLLEHACTISSLETRYPFPC